MSKHLQIPRLFFASYIRTYLYLLKRQPILRFCKIVSARSQFQVTDALARSTSISRSIYEAVEEVLPAFATGLASSFSFSLSKVNLPFSCFFLFYFHRIYSFYTTFVVVADSFLTKANYRHV